MTLTADEIIKEAEQLVQQKEKVNIEKKASEAAEDMINQRDYKDLEKIAESSPLVKLAMEKNHFLATKSFKDSMCLEKVATDSKIAMKFLRSLGTSEAGKRIAIGAGIGAGTGLLASRPEDRMGGAVKGALLGGLGGAAYHVYKGLPKATGADNVSRWLGKEAPVSGTAREQALQRLGKTSDSLNANAKAKSTLSRGLASGETAIKADAFGGRRLNEANDAIRRANSLTVGSQEHTQAVQKMKDLTGQYAPGKQWFGLSGKYKEISDTPLLSRFGIGNSATKLQQEHASTYMSKAKSGLGVLDKRLAGIEGKGQAQAKQFQTAEAFKGKMDEALTPKKGLPTLGMKGFDPNATPATPATRLSAPTPTPSPATPPKRYKIKLPKQATSVTSTNTQYIPAIERAGDIQRSYESNVHKFNALG
jgi:hypothetical protein